MDGKFHSSYSLSYLEAGFGTSSFRKYGYAAIGEPCWYEHSKLAHNLSMIAALSKERVELIQYIYKGGCTNAVFGDYLEKLIAVCRNRYKNKTITILCDNLRSHKCTEVMKVI